MPANNPFRCSFAAMVQHDPANDGYVTLLNTGSYPGFSNFLNSTWVLNTDVPNWTQLTGPVAASPVPLRKDFAMAWDGYNTILFGGREEAAGALNDTWSWNGSAWTKLAPSTKPFSRFQSKMAFLNATAPKAVMFGGATTLELTNETWVWNGHSGTLNWVKANSTLNPSARTDFGLAGSATQVVLFGGKGTAELLNDSWSFDGAQWTKLAPTTPPPALEGAALVYDSTNDEFVLFGGSTGYELKNETWVLAADGSAWTKKTPAHSPPARVGAMMSDDTDGDQVVLFGGSNGTDTLNDTWAWDGTDWVQL